MSYLKSQVEESRLELELLQPVGEVVLSPIRMIHLKSNPIYMFIKPNHRTQVDLRRASANLYFSLLSYLQLHPHGNLV